MIHNTIWTALYAIWETIFLDIIINIVFYHQQVLKIWKGFNSHSGSKQAERKPTWTLNPQGKNRAFCSMFAVSKTSSIVAFRAARPYLELMEEF